MDNETVKEFLKYLNKTDTKVLSLDDLLTELKNTPERDITGTLETNILSPKKGLISIDTFLDNLITDDNQGHFLSNPEIKDLENDTTKYTHDDEWYTYNDWYTFSEKDDYLAHDINMNMFVNNNGNYLVFLQVYTGEDERYGFSNDIALKFDTKEDYENAFLYDSTEYILASCLVETQEGTTLNSTVTSKPLNTLAHMYVMNDDTMREVFSTDIHHTDFDSIKDEIDDYIYDNKELSKKYHIKEFTDYDGNVYIAN